MLDDFVTIDAEINNNIVMVKTTTIGPLSNPATSHCFKRMSATGAVQRNLNIYIRGEKVSFREVNYTYYGGQ